MSFEGSSKEVLPPPPKKCTANITTSEESPVPPKHSPKKCKLTDVTNKSYTYETINGWIHCRSAEFDFSFKRSTSDSPPVSPKRRKKIQAESRKGMLPYKEKRFTCPDCEKWYESDKAKVQLSCRHRVPYDTEEELKNWDIEDYNSSLVPYNIISVLDQDCHVI